MDFFFKKKLVLWHVYLTSFINNSKSFLTDEHKAK